MSSEDPLVRAIDKILDAIGVLFDSSQDLQKKVEELEKRLDHNTGHCGVEDDKLREEVTEAIGRLDLRVAKLEGRA